MESERLAGGGPAAALTGATAAELCALVGRVSQDSWPHAGAVIAQAEWLGDRLRRLAEVDSEAYARARVLLRQAVEAGSQGEGEAQESRDGELARALHASAAVPLEIAEAAADVANLAAWLAEDAVTDIRADAVVAASLAAAAAIAAAHLVVVNLGVRGDDALATRAAAAVTSAGAARGRALD